ncbi:uncharacterized protein N7498_007146 [Penicillium cinerascens]|uniref:Aflatoxin regulatory protein domain-containing protein n=1 Tax=Penicillium cinerascens TaxID=70096 RepID=A0A9W9JJC6_9EURO|nr:uncharacterized protein N7498_007146 [Penicillium cinerascens]KAJ5198029.1 hypothetical protein N7498_007146 [Penicillium cinerascens]
MCNPVFDDANLYQCRSSVHSTTHSDHAQLSDQFDGQFLQQGQNTPRTDKARDFDHALLKPSGAFDIPFSKDSGPFPGLLPGNNDDWYSAMPQFEVPTNPLHPIIGSAANTGLFGDPSLEAPEVDLNVDLSSALNLQPLVETPHLSSSTGFGVNANSDFCMDYALGSDNFDEPMLDCSVLPDYLLTHNRNQSFPSLSTLPFCSDDSLSTPVLTPLPPTTTTSSCLAQRRPPCILTATQNLRLLHICETSCLSLRNPRSRCGSQDVSGPEPARMSGSVLKDNKDAGMSVCRMLQCGCALRPQNQIILALICSRLAVWYRAMIRACFSRRPSSCSGDGDCFDEQTTSPEKVIYQAITIGDHTVENLSLERNIQAQVILVELGHLQRLINTLSDRIRQTGTSYQMGLDANADPPSTGLPGVAHDRLVAHLSKEVQAAKNDLITAWTEHQKLEHDDKNIRHEDINDIYTKHTNTY